jgi:hypothetical protein
MGIVQSRRHLLANIAMAGATRFTGLGAASLCGGRKSVAAEPPPHAPIRSRPDASCASY